MLNNSPWLAPALKIAEEAEKGFASKKYPKDKAGFYICPKCNTRVQEYIKELNRKMPVSCECSKAEAKRIEEERQRLYVENMRIKSFATKEMHKYNFKVDNGANPKISTASKNYVEHFEEFRKKGKGIIFYGSTGSGKTFFACCIANALIDKGYKIRQTNFSRLESEIRQSYDRQAIIDNYARTNDLVIIDDLGVERNTAYMKEIVFNVIDTLYCENVPFIVTTNLTAKELKNPADLDNVRIYQRILERCHPIEVENSSGSQRLKIFIENFEQDKKLLGV